MIHYGVYEAMCKDGIPETAVTKVDSKGDTWVLYIPTAKAVEFHAAPERYVLGEGGRNSAKSTTLRWDAHLRNMMIPGHRALLLRRTFPQLQGSHFSQTAIEGKALDCNRDFNQSKYFLEYNNGSLLKFGHCYDEQTEALTERGFVRFADLTPDDRIATRTPAGFVVFDRPLAIQQFAHNGEMVRFQSQGMDLLVTPDHPIVCWDGERELTFRADEMRNQSQHRPLKLKRVGKWKGVEQPIYTFTHRTGYTPVDSMPMDDWLYMLGWFISEGCLTQYTRPDGTIIKEVSISQKKYPEVIDRLAQIFRAVGWAPVIESRMNGVRVIKITKHQLFDELAAQGKSHQKHVPAFVKALSPRQIELVFNGIFGGDGRIASGTRLNLVSTSKCLVDDVQELLMRVGIASTVTVRKPVENRKAVYQVTLVHERTEPCLTAKYISTEHYTGRVYDVTMPQSPIIFVRRNGIGVWGHNCESDAAIMDYLSQEWDWIGFDELTTFSFDQFIRISMSSRSGKHSGKKAFIRGATNPIGEGASWVKRYFIDRSITPDENRNYKKDMWRSIKMNLIDNPHASEGYQQELEMLPNETLRRAYINGEWLVEGQFFAQFAARQDEREWHVIEQMPRFPINDTMTPAHLVPWIQIVRFLDWGYSEMEPGYCGWVAMMPDGTAIVFKEWVFTGQIPEKAAQKIKEMSEGLKVRFTVGDPMMWQEKTGESIAETFARNGVSMIAADNDRENGWARVHSWLSTVYNDGTGPQPRLQFLAPDVAGTGLGVPYLIRTLPSLQTNPKKPKDIVEGQGVEDHGADGLRYWASNRPSPSHEPQKTLDWVAPEIRASMARAMSGEGEFEL